MRRFFLTLVFMLSCSLSYGSINEHWEQHWHHGVNFLQHGNYKNAAIEFNYAKNLMSEEQQLIHPYVLLGCAETDLFFKDYFNVLVLTETALKSENITDYERLICGIWRITAYLNINNEQAATEEYRKYIIDCPLFPKFSYSDEIIIIRNVLDCKFYKDNIKQYMLLNYCDKIDDISTYSDMWIVNITKKSKHIYAEENFNNQMMNRTPAQVQACCNTCNTLAAAGQVICGCLPIPAVLAGPASMVACRIACAALVERFRQDCEMCCHQSQGKCLGGFENWKDIFKKEHPECPHPVQRCPS